MIDVDLLVFILGVLIGFIGGWALNKYDKVN